MINLGPLYLSVECYVSSWTDLTCSMMDPEEVPQREKLPDLGSPRHSSWHAANPPLQLGMMGDGESHTVSSSFSCCSAASSLQSDSYPEDWWFYYTCQESFICPHHWSCLEDSHLQLLLSYWKHRIPVSSLVIMYLSFFKLVLPRFLDHSCIISLTQ